jgi:hypothetical protein
MDFVLEGDDRSMHELNTVSPEFTCAIPFAEYVAAQIEERLGGGAAGVHMPGAATTASAARWEAPSGPTAPSV